MVYVLNNNGQPIMPTKNHAKVRILLKQGKAKVIHRCPFTIQLLYHSTSYTQNITLGVDAGSKHIGISATTEDTVLFEADVAVRNDITELLATRRELRRTRRNRKIRYRKPRFDNRKRKDGWLAPSVQNKVDTHLTIVRKVHRILPITKMVVETAAFDLQKLKADINGLKRPEGTDYQQGDQMGFWNIREYVLFRDGHKCQCCKGKSKDPVLNVHHIESRKTGGNAPNNLITLCETCHKGFHKGTVKLLSSIKRGISFRDATFMGIMRWAFYNRLKEMYPDVHMTYGYITKNTRIRYGLSEKNRSADDKHYPLNHVIDARCISGHPKAVSDGTVYYLRKVRCHNRQIHKMSIGRGGIRKRNQAPYEIKGFKLYDEVKAKGVEWYIHGRRSKGAFTLKTLDGTALEIVPSKIQMLCKQHSYLCERRIVG